MENKVYLVYQYNVSKTDSRFKEIVCRDEETAKEICLQLMKMYPNNETYYKEIDLISNSKNEI